MQGFAGSPIILRVCGSGEAAGEIIIMFSGSDSAKNHFKCSVDQMSGKPLYGDKKIIIRRMRVRRFGLGRLELADFFYS